MSADFSEFSKLVQSANLIEISLKSSNNNCSVPPKAVIPKNISLNYDRTNHYILSEDEGLLVCFCGMAVVATDDSKEDGSIFELSATFSLIYSINQTGFSKEAFSAFTEKNAFYNAYPYFREFFQNMSSRMGIEPVKLPLLKPSTKDELKKELNSEKGKLKSKST